MNIDSVFIQRNEFSLTSFTDDMENVINLGMTNDFFKLKIFLFLFDILIAKYVIKKI